MARRLAAGAVLLAIGVITLAPRPEAVSGSALCLICGRRGTADAVLNMILFAPVGWLVASRVGRRSLLWALAVGGALSLVIELAQMAIPGRDASAGDVVFNAAGALAGAGAWWFRARSRLAVATRAWIALAAGAALLATGAGLLGPELPDTRWWGQWSPALGHLRAYEGEVVSAAVGGEPIPGGGELRRVDAVRRRLRRHAPLEAVATGAAPAPGVAPIVSIYDEHQREVVLLGVDGGDVVWRFRTRGAALRFDVASLRFAGAAAGFGPADTLRLRVAPSEPGRPWGEGTCLRAAGRTAGCARSTPASTWSLLLPSAGVPGRVLELLWIAGLFLPAGVLAARAAGRITAFVGAAAAFAVVAVPAFTPVGAAPLSEVVVAAAAVWLPRAWRIGPGAARRRGPATPAPPGLR